MKRPMLPPHLQVWCVSTYIMTRRGYYGERGLLSLVLETAALVAIARAAYTLAADDVSAEEAHRRVGQVFSCARALSPYGCAGEGVVVLWQAHEFEDGWM